MSEPKEITGVLWFSEHEPCVFGHLQIGPTHYEIAGVRSDFRTDLTGRRVERPRSAIQMQRDLFGADDE